VKIKIKQANNLIPGAFTEGLHTDTYSSDRELSRVEWFLLCLTQFYLKAVSSSGENCHVIDFLGVMTIYILRICLTLRTCFYYLKADTF